MCKVTIRDSRKGTGAGGLGRKPRTWVTPQQWISWIASSFPSYISLSGSRAAWNLQLQLVTVRKGFEKNSCFISRGFEGGILWDRGLLTSPDPLQQGNSRPPLPITGGSSCGSGPCRMKLLGFSPPDARWASAMKGPPASNTGRVEVTTPGLSPCEFLTSTRWASATKVHYWDTLPAVAKVEKAETFIHPIDSTNERRRQNTE